MPRGVVATTCSAMPAVAAAALAAGLALAAAAAVHGEERRKAGAEVLRDAACAPAVFAAGEVCEALRRAGYATVERALDALPSSALTVRVILAGQDLPAARERLKAAGAAGPPLPAQAFAICRAGGPERPEFWVIGGDAAGTMYGGLDLAEAVRLGGIEAVRGGTGRPAIERRGVKFNIPLDARTPSYDDSGDAAQENIAHMWDPEFWREFLDDMARARYNVLTLWNPHPFPSMVRAAEYADLALADVCVTTLKPAWKHGSIGEHMGVSQAVLENLKVVRRMTVEEKIDFWRRVMRRARERGIDVYIITWNVLTNSATGRRGITNDQDNPATIAYMRASVRELILTYPDLAGIGVTAGENMKDRKDEFSKEKWLWRTYGEGVLDAKKAQPGRKVAFIHRVWQTSAAEIVKEFGSKYPDTFDLGFKYAHARLYSSPSPPFAKPLCEEMRPHGLRCWWNLRNDDIFVFRWGDPEYVREFLRNLPPREQTAGYYVGSDGYVWGREFAGLQPDEPRQLEIRKHWYAFTLWGRLGYDLSLDRAFFEKTLAARFPELAAAGPLYEAWAEASKIIPLVNRFHWRDWDYMWSVEGCMDQRQGFHTVRDFSTCPTMQGSGLATISAYVDALAGGKAPPGREPLDVAAELDFRAEKALSLAAAVRQSAAQPAKELRQTLGDIEAMSHLGRYYAAKIRGAAALALFEKTRDESRRRRAVEHLEEAVGRWEAYAAAAARQYRPQLLARTRDLDWIKLLDDVKKDVEIARSATSERQRNP